MLYIGIMLIALATIIIIGSSEYSNSISLVFFFVFLFFGITFITMDVKSTKDKTILVDSYETNRIPIEYNNPDNIKLVIKNISDKYIYLDNPILLNKYENRSKHKIFITKDIVYEIRKTE